jgi:biotin carboxyl carrier protein
MTLNKKNYLITINGVQRHVTLDGINRNNVSFTVENHQFNVTVDPVLAVAHNSSDSKSSAPIIMQSTSTNNSRVDCSDGIFRAPMPGILVKLEVEVGQTIEPGQQVAVIEAMKMENAVNCPIGGKVMEVLAKGTSEIKKGQELFKIS